MSAEIFLGCAEPRNDNFTVPIYNTRIAVVKNGILQKLRLAPSLAFILGVPANELAFDVDVLVTHTGRNSNQTLAVKLCNGRPSKVAVRFAALVANNRFECVINHVGVFGLAKFKVVVVKINGSATPNVKGGVERFVDIQNDVIGFSCGKHYVRLAIFIVYRNGIAVGINNRYKLCIVCDLKFHIFIAGCIGRAFDVKVERKTTVFTNRAERKCSLVYRRTRLLSVTVAVLEINPLRRLFNVLEGCTGLARNQRFEAMLQKLIVVIFIVDRNVKIRRTVVRAYLNSNPATGKALVVFLFQDNCVFLNFVEYRIDFSVCILKPNIGCTVKISSKACALLKSKRRTVRYGHIVCISNVINHTNGEALSCGVGSMVIHQIATLAIFKTH